MGIFTAAKEGVWKTFSEEVSGKFIKDKLYGDITVEVVHGPWHIIFDTSEAVREEEGYFITRLRAPIVNPKGFRFKAHREGFMSRLGKIVGLPDIEIGDPTFDSHFILKSNDKEKAVALFSKPDIHNAMIDLKYIHFYIQDSEGHFGLKFSDDEDELVLEMNGIVTDLSTLEKLFHLFAITLDDMVEMGYIEAKEPVSKL